MKGKAVWYEWRRPEFKPLKVTMVDSGQTVKRYRATEAEHKVLANTLRELRLSKNNRY